MRFVMLIFDVEFLLEDVEVVLAFFVVVFLDVVVAYDVT